MARDADDGAAGDGGPDGDARDQLEQMADELYAAMPNEFIGVRTDLARRARSAGDTMLARRVAGLRKPTTAGWLVNALVRHRGAEVDQLLDLGEALRTAQAALAGDQLRDLARQRQQVVAAMARQARGLARELGNPVSPAVADEVEETLRAALADPEVADAVRSGRLTASLSYAGMGETGAARVADVIALAPRRADRDARRTKDEGVARARRRAAELSRLRGEVDAARRAAEHARRIDQDAAGAFAAAQRRHDDAREDVRALQAQLQRAQAELAEAGDEAATRRRERDSARHAAAVADRAFAVARDALAAEEASP